MLKLIDTLTLPFKKLLSTLPFFIKYPCDFLAKHAIYRGMNIRTSQEPLPQYRPNAGLCIINDKGQILACERSDIKGAWQCPQGGIDDSETPEQAAWRELFEETGITVDAAKLAQTHPNWLSYTFPKVAFGPEGPQAAHKGQTQKWFLFHYNGALPNPNTVEHKEFSAFAWKSPQWLLDNVVDFRQGIYRAVFAEFELV